MNILIAGDFAPKERVVNAIDTGRGEELFASIKPILKDVDYSLVNLEAPYSKTLSTPIKKKGPHLNAKLNAIELIKKVGFSGCTLANNHINDYGADGISETITVLNKLGIDHVGLGMNSIEAAKPLVIDVKGYKVAFINICENEYSITDEDLPGACPVDPIKNFKQISNARQTADYVIIIVHGGHEYYQLPSPRMKELYHYYIDSGADVVINHHQHCFSGYEYYNGKPIVYGLGNLCFDSKKRMNSSWNYGYMCILEIENSELKISTIPYKQALSYPAITLLSGNEITQFEQRIDELNSIISNDHLLKSEYLKFIEKKTKAIIGVFAPYPSEYLREAASRGYIPTLMNNGQIATILNYIMCESQRDVSIGVLKNLLGK